MNLVLLLDAIGAPITGGTTLLALGLVCSVLALIACTRAREQRDIPAVVPPAGERGRAWLLIPAALALAALALKASLDPLSDYDTGFRWDFLARQVLLQRDLGFYPPVTTEDFLHYGWCDGIAPLISSLYLWVYFSLGKTAAWATIPVVLAQAVLLFRLVHELAALHAGSRAGRHRGGDPGHQRGSALGRGHGTGDGDDRSVADRDVPVHRKTPPPARRQLAVPGRHRGRRGWPRANTVWRSSPSAGSRSPGSERHGDAGASSRSPPSRSPPHGISATGCAPATRSSATIWRGFFPRTPSTPITCARSAISARASRSSNGPILPAR